MKKINQRYPVLLLFAILPLSYGLFAADLGEKRQSSKLDDIFLDGKKIFYDELKLNLGRHPLKYRLLQNSILKIHDAEEGILFLYENLINITYVKENARLQILIERQDEDSLKNFRREYFKLCQKTAGYFIQSLFQEQADIKNLLMKPNNRGKTRLELVLDSFAYENNIQKNETTELFSIFNGYDFRKQWGFKISKFKEAHVFTKGQGVKIALIGSGIKLNHDLIQQANINHDFDFCLVDRRKAPWNNEIVPVDDETGRGTLMTSIVSACAPEAEIRIYKVGYAPNPPYPFWTAMQVTQAIYKAVDDKADVIILDFGIFRDFKFLRDACQSAYSKNAVIVAPNSFYSLSNPEKAFYFPAHYNCTVAASGVVPGVMNRPVAWDESASSHYTSVAASAFLGEPKGRKSKDSMQLLSPSNTWTAAIVGSLTALISSKLPKIEKELSGQYFQRIYEVLVRSADPGALGFKSFNPKVGYGLVNAEMAVNQELKVYLEKMKRIEENFKKRLKQLEEEKKKEESKKKKK